MYDYKHICYLYNTYSAICNIYYYVYKYNLLSLNNVTYVIIIPEKLQSYILTFTHIFIWLCFKFC